MKYLFCFCLLCSNAVYAEEWGRLFFSPAERAAVSGAGALAGEVQPLSNWLSFDGEVSHRRKKIRWINREMTASAVPPGLKVGQIINLQTGEVRDVYQPAPRN